MKSNYMYKIFSIWLKINLKQKLKTIRSNNGPQFFLNEFFASNGILHQTSCVVTPEHNGRVARKYEHILNVANTLMFQSHIPNHFWSYAIKHVYLINWFHHQFIGIKHLLNFYTNKYPIFTHLKFLVVWYIHPPNLQIVISLIHDLNMELSWVLDVEPKAVLF